MVRRLVISAFGIHSGGGAVLLRALLAQASGDVRHAFLDARAADEMAQLLPSGAVTPVAPTLIARLAAGRAVAGVGSAGDVLLAFNSQPPLARSAARVITYVQASYFTGMDSGIAYSTKATARHWIERRLFAAGAANTDEIWVQTPGMADGVRRRAAGARVRVVPFVDGDAARPCASAPLGDPAARFFYPADGAAHKNHARLLQAWALLAAEGARPPLLLTLTPPEHDAALAAADLTAEALPHVVVAGRVPRAEVLERLRDHALVFPSLTESFGLPLIEAEAAGAPILASERDYTRDVCRPSITFDPLSPRSIADAVLRHLGRPRPVVEPIGAAAFVAELLAA